MSDGCAKKLGNDLWHDSELPKFAAENVSNESNVRKPGRDQGWGSGGG